MKLLSNLFKKKEKIQNRKVTKARFLYLYTIFGAIFGLAYFMLSFFVDIPWHWALSPLYGIVLFVVGRFVIKNWKLILLYVRDIEQGSLLLYLNDNTHWSEKHKMKVINWVYLRRKTVRQETYAKITGKLMDEGSLSKEEARKLKYRSVYCPQQIKDGFNEAMLVHVLIYAHRNIQVLDDDLREIMSLTDENMLAFSLSKEAEKATSKKYQKMMETGKRVSENLKK
jgi:hypothetical protein